MTKRNFNAWLNTFRLSINSYSYYTDFKKVLENVKKFKLEICILNSLIGSQNIEADFEKIIRKYPECLQVIPLLLAVRHSEIYCQDDKGAILYNFSQPEQSPEQYKYFMQKTGLFDMLKNSRIKDLADYCTGVEVGLDSNARKNRGGHQMENLVEKYLVKANIDYYKEMYLNEIESKWGIDLSAISGEGTSSKRWDFVVKTPSCIYVIETNFYTSNGSKLNETARSYKMLAEEAKKVKGFCFVWITDGQGWLSARGNLEETFNVLNAMFNIKDMEDGALNTLFNTGNN